jgi:hypothetical protein
MPAVYNLLPNHTDFTIFKEAGLPGLNFAFIDGYSNYHSEADNLENVDERSIQHEGSNALALTRHFGNVSLENISASDVIYFDLLGSTMVIYSMRLVLPLTFSVLILYAALVIYGFRKQRLTASGIAHGCLVLLLCLGSVAVAVTIIQSIAPSLNTASGTRSDLYMLCLVALALAISFALYALFLREVSLENLTIGGLFCWAMLMLWTSFYLPGASFLFTWPLLFNLIACGLKLISKQRESESLMILAAQVFAVIATILILTPAIYTTYIALTLSRAVLVSMLVVPLSVLLIPHFNLESLMNKRRRSGAAVLITPA